MYWSAARAGIGTCVECGEPAEMLMRDGRTLCFDHLSPEDQAIVLADREHWATGGPEH